MPVLPGAGIYQFTWRCGRMAGSDARAAVDARDRISMEHASRAVRASRDGVPPRPTERREARRSAGDTS